jgi:hypothetical protein
MRPISAASGAARQEGGAMIRGIVAAALGAVIWAGSAEAAGNLTARATRLPPLVFDKELKPSIQSYELTTGTYYRLTVESKVGDEWQFAAPELFANSFVDQIAIRDIEIHGARSLGWIEFDADGAVNIFFIPIRPGEYGFGVKGREAAGKFVVK